MGPLEDGQTTPRVKALIEPGNGKQRVATDGRTVFAIALKAADKRERLMRAPLDGSAPATDSDPFAEGNVRELAVDTANVYLLSRIDGHDRITFRAHDEASRARMLYDEAVDYNEMRWGFFHDGDSLYIAQLRRVVRIVTPAL